MIAIIFILFILAPLLSVPFILVGFLYDKRFTALYSIMFGIVLGIIAYYLQPPVSFDLFRHHEVVDSFAGYTWTAFLSSITSTSEPIQAFISYTVSLTRNHDLLQFGVVAVGYSILLYIIGDYARRNSIKKSTVFFVLIFTLASFSCVNFFSGLWNYLAMLVFSLAFYWDISKLKSKVLTYPLYLLTPLIHSSMFLPSALLFIFKLLKEMVTVKTILLVSALLLAPSVVLPIINGLTDIAIFAQLQPMYVAYFENGAKFTGLYDGSVFIMEILKIGVIFFSAFTIKNITDAMRKTRAFVILLSISTLLLVLNSIVLLRFVLLAQFLGAPLLMKFIDDMRGRNRYIFLMFIVAFTGIFIFYQYATLKNLNFSALGLDDLMKSIFLIFNKGQI